MAQPVCPPPPFSDLINPRLPRHETQMGHPPPQLCSHKTYLQLGNVLPGINQHRRQVMPTQLQLPPESSPTHPSMREGGRKEGIEKCRSYLHEILCLPHIGIVVLDGPSTPRDLIEPPCRGDQGWPLGGSVTKLLGRGIVAEWGGHGINTIVGEEGNGSCPFSVMMGCTS